MVLNYLGCMLIRFFYIAWNGMPEFGNEIVSLLSLTYSLVAGIIRKCLFKFIRQCLKTYCIILIFELYCVHACIVYVEFLMQR